MSINLGLRAHDTSVHTFEHLFAVTSNYGLNNVQFAPFKFLPPELINSTDLYSPGMLTMIADKFKRAHVKISVLGNYVNIIEYDRAKQQQNLQSFYDSLVAEKFLPAAVVGTETGSVLSPLGYTTDNYTESALQRVISAVTKMSRTAEKLGSLLAIEPGVNHPLYNNYTVRRVLDAVNSPNLFVIFDLANLLSFENQGRQEQILETAARLYGDRICMFHLKDVQFVNGRKETVPFGTGVVDAERYIAFINRLKPFTYATFEATKEKDLESAVQVVRRLDQKYSFQLK
ncbi:MAG: sugar phosphate isomerase/epimerase family protein [Limosilactobacillus sp.]